MQKTETNLSEYWFAIRRHSRLIAAVVLGTLLVTAFFTFREPDAYQASTTFYFPLSGQGSGAGLAQTVMGKEGGGGSGLLSALLPPGGQDVQNYTKGILQSRRVAEILEDHIHLTDRWHLGRKSTAVAIIRGATGIRLSSEGIMEVTVQTPDPQLSADIANGYVEAFREFSSSSMVSIAQKHRMDVEDRIKQLKGELLQAEGNMRTFQLKHKTADFTQEEKVLMNSLQTLHAEDFSSGVALEAAQNTLHRILDLTGDQLRAVSREPLITPNFSDPILHGLRDSLADVYVKYSQAKLTETPANPELKSYKSQLANLEAAMRTQIQRQLHAESNGVSDDLLSLNVKIAQIKAKQSAIKVGIGQLEKKFNSYPAILVEYLGLERHVKLLEAMDTFLAGEYEKARLDEAKESPDFQVLDRAVRPEVKAGPHRLYNMGIGLFLGAFLGLAAAFSVESIKPTHPIPVDSDGDGRIADYELELAEPPKRS